MTRAAVEPVSIVLDGSEARPAVFRASLTLSAITRRSLDVRWEGDSPLLSSECSAAINAAQPLLGKFEESSPDCLHFNPGGGPPASSRIELGHAEIAPVVEMVELPLALGGAPSELRLVGVTHGSGATSFHELLYGWQPLAERLGLASELVLEGAGFSADGGGTVAMKVFPAPRLRPADLTQRGMLLEVQAIVLLANLRMGIALPLERRLNERLRTCGISAQSEILPLPADRVRGLAIVIAAQFERTRVAFAAVGVPGRSAEATTDEAVDRLEAFLARHSAVPGELAERLLVPLAVASSSWAAPGAIGREPRGPSRLTTSNVTGRLLTLADVARRFLDVEIQVQGLPGDEGLIEVRPA